MAAVIKLANTLQKHQEKPEIAEYLSTFGDEWKTFTEGELKSSNTLNTRSLGGQQPRNAFDGDEDESSSYETNMERIMARFSNFTSNMQSSDTDDTDNTKEDDMGN